MRLTLKPYQAEGASRMRQFLSQNVANSVYNGSDPGLGKTAMTCTTMDLMNMSKMLVVCPATVRLTWEFECGLWMHSRRYKILVINSNRDVHKLSLNPDIVIISYDLVSMETNAKALMKETFECLVLDEAHKLKTMKSKRSKTILNKIWKTVKYKIAMSGTPFRTCVTDCHPVFSRMAPGIFGTLDEFGNKFSYAKFTPWGVKYDGIRDHALLSKTIRENFFIRYKKEEVAPELPPKIFNRIILPKSLGFDAYEKALKEIYPDVDCEPNLEFVKRIPDHLMGLMRVQGELKCDTIFEYTSDLLDQGIPVILFAVNKSVIARYKELFRAYNPVVIDGSTSPKMRGQAVADFQAGTTDLFIGNIQAAGEGITLTRASNVVLAQATFSPAEVFQATDRAHRIGQRDLVNVHWFVVQGSIDERIMGTVMKRAENFNKVLN